MWLIPLDRVTNTLKIYAALLVLHSVPSVSRENTDGMWLYHCNKVWAHIGFIWGSALHMLCSNLSRARWGEIKVAPPMSGCARVLANFWFRGWCFKTQWKWHNSVFVYALILPPPNSTTPKDPDNHGCEKATCDVLLSLKHSSSKLKLERFVKFFHHPCCNKSGNCCNITKERGLKWLAVPNWVGPLEYSL